MGLPTLTKSWSFLTNSRYTFATVIGATGDLMFKLAGSTGFLTQTMGYTCKGSCNGTTGAMDGVNRITSAAQWATRNNGAAGAMSWIVLTDGAGVDWCFSFNSASDDIVRLSHSTAGLFVAAGTPTQQPTATDECFDAASGSWVNATASADRIWNFMATSDKKQFRIAVLRSSALVALICGEEFVSALVAPATLTLTTGGGTKAAIKTFINTTALNTQVNNAYAVASFGDLARVHCGGIDTNVSATVGCEMPGGSVGSVASTNSLFNAEKPLLQGGNGELLFPAQLGARAAAADGKLGSKIDWWIAITNSTTVPALIDTYGSLQFISYGPGVIWAWDGVNNPVAA